MNGYGYMVNEGDMSGPRTVTREQAVEQFGEFTVATAETTLQSMKYIDRRNTDTLPPADSVEIGFGDSLGLLVTARG